MLIDILNDLLYTVFKPNFECFRKVRYFAKFFMEKDAPRRPFVVFRMRLIGRQIVVARICIGFKAA
jgi:hypothetical protein